MEARCEEREKRERKTVKERKRSRVTFKIYYSLEGNIS